MYQENICLTACLSLLCQTSTILYHFFPSTDKYGERFSSILTTALTSNTWKVQVVLLAAIKLFIERLGFIFVCLYLKARFTFIVQVGYEDFSSPIFLLIRMDWTYGTPDGGGEESIDRITMLRNLLGQFIPSVCECLGLLHLSRRYNV